MIWLWLHERTRTHTHSKQASFFQFRSKPLPKPPEHKRNITKYYGTNLEDDVLSSSSSSPSSSPSTTSSESEDGVILKTPPIFFKSKTVADGDSTDEEKAISVRSPAKSVHGLRVYEKLRGSDDDIDNKVHSKFLIWLCNVIQLGQYIVNFEENGKADVRKIKYFNDQMLRNLGISMKVIVR